MKDAILATAFVYFSRWFKSIEGTRKKQSNTLGSDLQQKIASTQRAHRRILEHLGDKRTNQPEVHREAIDMLQEEPELTRNPGPKPDQRQQSG